MAQTHTDTNVNQLIINKLTKQEYNNLQQVSDTELYLVEEQVDSVVAQNSTNPVQSGAVYEALQDIGGTINDGTTTFTKNNETIGTTSANQSDNKTIALPNDIVMCNLIENKALASYANTITRLKYIEDHGWVDMDRSNIQYNEGTGEWTGTFVSLDITEGEYYYDMDNDTVFVADENSEMQDVTSTVIIQGDSNKLYCDTTTNMLYRYDGSDFVALTSNFSGSYNDLINKPLSVENSKVKYTLSDGTTKLTLAQESDLATIAFSGKSLDSPDFYFLKPDYKTGVIIADITDAYTASSSTVDLPYQGFNGTVIFSREVGNIYDTCAQITCCISYKSDYIRLYTNNTQIRPQIRTYNNRYYLCINSDTISAGRFYLYGVGKNLTTFEAFDDDSYTLVQDCYNIINSAEIVFPSNVDSGNLASGETLAVMMKKIARVQNLAITINTTKVSNANILCTIVGNMVLINGSFKLSATEDGVIIGYFPLRLANMTSIGFNSNTSCELRIMYTNEYGCILRGYSAQPNINYTFGCVTSLYIQ